MLSNLFTFTSIENSTDFFFLFANYFDRRAVLEGDKLCSLSFFFREIKLETERDTYFKCHANARRTYAPIQI